MTDLIRPHGSDTLRPLLLAGPDRDAELARGASLPQWTMSSRETGDLIMLGNGGFTPLAGFMNRADWDGVCRDMRTAAGVFWPIPITLSVSREFAVSLKDDAEIALLSGDTGELIATMRVQDRYEIDAEFECRQVFGTADPAHPGVQMVMAQPPVNLGGPVKVLSESYFPTEFAGLYLRPAETRRIFAERGWSRIAALQLRNPMHRSHEYLAKIALEVSDGLFIHQLVGKLKPGDIPADVRVACIDALVDGYFVKDSVLCGGYPLDMRYAGPREGLLHGVFRQNHGCTHMIIGRDHAGVGDYYGPFDAQKIWSEIPAGALEIRMLPIDWTFWCYKCGGMVSMKTCPHGKADRLFLSGTALRKALSEGGAVPAEFSRPEVLEILQQYYAGLTAAENVKVDLHKTATGEKAGPAR
ncbi:MAG: sulfate adenylyltransferase [Candidatus Krumholzibacteria bacterium]|nr:sulfate adenylyltransferase [Candidatus Krumholzibacteria bacterium]